jgi:hypothetical protein
MQTATQTNEKCYISFWERLNENLKNPDYKQGFEKAKEKVNLQVMINNLLQDTGHSEYCVEVMNVDDY